MRLQPYIRAQKIQLCTVYGIPRQKCLDSFCISVSSQLIYFLLPHSMCPYSENGFIFQSYSTRSRTTCIFDVFVVYVPNCVTITFTMPKCKDKGSASMWIQDYPELIIDGNRIFCRICHKSVSFIYCDLFCMRTNIFIAIYCICTSICTEMDILLQLSIDKKYNVIQHVKTALHQTNTKFKSNLKQQTITEVIVNQQQPDFDSFASDLCTAFVSANIPLRKLENKQLKSFIEKYCDRQVPSESNLRKKYINSTFEQVFSVIKNSVKHQYLYITVVFCLLCVSWKLECWKLEYI